MSEENNDQRQEGVVCWFSASKGFGFVAPDDGGDDIFCHWSNIEQDGFKTLHAEQRVSYKLGTNHRGLQAVEVKLLDTDEE